MISRSQSFFGVLQAEISVAIKGSTLLRLHLIHDEKEFGTGKSLSKSNVLLMNSSSSAKQTVRDPKFVSQIVVLCDNNSIGLSQTLSKYYENSMRISSMYRYLMPVRSLGQRHLSAVLLLPSAVTSYHLKIFLVQFTTINRQR